MRSRKLNSLSIVVSVYNEEEALQAFWNTLSICLKEIKNIDFEIIFINDGSSDKSKEIIETIISDKANSLFEFVFIDFTRNFGHESAMIAGIDVTNKDAVICLDADLQHPPSKIKNMIKKYNEGFEIVTMIRQKRADNGTTKNVSSNLFYKVLNRISDYKFDKNASDFFLISKSVTAILKDNFRERNRFLRGYIQTIGFSKTSLFFDAPVRVGGKSSYSLKSLLKLSFTAIFSFSNKPLRIALVVSILFAIFTTSISIYSLIVYFFGKTPPSGYTTLIIFQSVCFTILFLLIGILSMYFANTLSEIRKRPIYLVENLVKKNTKPND